MPLLRGEQALAVVVDGGNVHARAVELELLETPDPKQSGITVAVVASAGSEGAL